MTPCSGLPEHPGAPCRSRRADPLASSAGGRVQPFRWAFQRRGWIRLSEGGASLCPQPLAAALLVTLLCRAAHAAAPAAATAPAWWPWSLAALVALLVLACWQLQLLIDAWQWLAVNIGGLLTPLRSRRHVIHDPGYLRQIVEAEIEVNPELSRSSSSRPTSGRSGRRGGGRRTSFRGRRRSGSP